MSGEKRQGLTLGGLSKRFAGDFGFKALTELVSAVFGLYCFAILSRLLGDSGEYAVLNQTVAMSTLLVPLLLVRANTALCVFVPGDKDQSRVRSRFFMTLLVALLCCGMLCIPAYIFNQNITLFLWGDTSYSHLVPLLVLYFSVMALSSLCQSFLQATGHQKKANVFVLLRCGFNATGFTLLAFGHSGDATVLRQALWIYILTESILFVAQFILLLVDWRGVRLSLRAADIHPLYRYALPLLPVTVMAWLNSFIGRFLLNHLIQDELRSASIYGFYDALTSRAFLVNAVLVSTVFPYIAKAWNQHDRKQVIGYLHKSFNIGLFAAVPILFGIVLICPTLIHWMADGNYPTDRTLLLVLCLAQLCQMLYMNFSYLIDLSRQSQWYNSIFAVSCAVNVLLCLVLVPEIGYVGAAVGLLCSYGLQLAIAAGISYHLAGISVAPSLLQAAKAVFSACVMYAVCHLLYYRGQVQPVGGVWECLLTVVTGVVVYFACQWLLCRLTKTKLI